MYREHQRAIQIHCENDRQAFERCLQFALMSAQMPFFRMEEIMLSLRQEGLESKWVSPKKREGLIYIATEIDPLRDYILDHRPSDAHSTLVRAMRASLGIPGIGLVKAGFICQLLRGEAGCLDRHNSRKNGWTATRTARPTTEDAIMEYIGRCEQAGGSERLWNEWCHLIARLYPLHFRSAEHISAIHVRCIVGDYGY